VIRPFSKIIYPVLLLFLTFCGWEPAQSTSVPKGFSETSFDTIIHFALQNYIDPDSVDISRAYVGAAEMALRSLPYPLVLMPKEFYDNREKFQQPDRILPGSPIYLSSGDPFLVFKPDYIKIEQIEKEREKREKERRKALTPAQKQREAEAAKEQGLAELSGIEQAWKKSGFSQRDFKRIIEWIGANREKYSKTPSTFKGNDPYEDDPFGMHHAYFAAANGFLLTMDPHSGVIDRESWEKILKESEDSTFEGIGALLRGGGNQDVIVETPLANSPALKAGLRAGDIIRKVDERSVEGLPLNDVVKMIRGARDTYVELEVERIVSGEALSIKIKRGVIVQLAVSSMLFPNTKIGVIKVASFLHDGKETYAMVAHEYENLQKQAGKLDGLILDLRNNPGGFLNEAVNVAGLFLPRGKVIVMTKGRDSELVPRANDSNPVIKGVPVIVLINAGSASASEIVASALQDHDAALIVGERSFGKASVQEMRPGGDVIIKLTTARYYAPDGYTIQIYGVHPDIEISDELDGSFPLRFREEDMWKHLPKLSMNGVSPKKKAWIEKIRADVASNEKAEKFIGQHKTDAEKPDYMLIRAMSYFTSLKKFPRP
jgi:C-terminal peptidase prc